MMVARIPLSRDSQWITPYAPESTWETPITHMSIRGLMCTHCVPAHTAKKADNEESCICGCYASERLHMIDQGGIGKCEGEIRESCFRLLAL